jgi:hypothetical protein
VRALVLGLRFLSELALVACAALGGWRVGDGGVAGALVAAAGVAAVVGVWGRWIAPKARTRLEDPARLAVELALFAAVGTVLAVVDAALTGAVLAIGGCALAVGVRAVGGDGPVREE